MAEITRRRVLKAAPLVALAAVPAVEAAGGSEIGAYFDRIQKMTAALSVAAAERKDEETLTAALVAIDDVGMAMARLEPETAADLAMQIHWFCGDELDGFQGAWGIMRERIERLAGRPIPGLMEEFA